MGSAPVLSYFRLVSWSGVLLKRPMHAAKVQLGLRKYDFLKNGAVIHLLTDSYLLIDKNIGCLVTGANSTTDHERLRLLVMFDDGQRAGSFLKPEACSVVNNFLSVKMMRFHCSPAAPPVSSKPYALVFMAELLISLDCPTLICQVDTEQTMDHTVAFSEPM